MIFGMTMTASTPTPERTAGNVFISWSGPRSRAIAKALFDWLPLVVQSAQPWMSSESIDSGQLWRNKLSQGLQSIRTGIVCLCPENLSSIAIHFEAGALAGQFDDKARLIPYCFDLRPADVTWPLSDFQGRSADRDDTWKLVKSINIAMPTPLQEARLETCFESLWPRLENMLGKLPPPPTEGVQPARTPEQMMVEVLDLVRSIEREVTKQQELRLIDRFHPRQNSINWAALAAAARTTAPLAESARDDAVSLAASLAAAGGDPPV